MRTPLATSGEQGSGGIPGTDHMLVTRGPAGRVGLLGLLVFLDTQGAGEAGLPPYPPYLVPSWTAADSPAHLRQHGTCCVTLWLHSASLGPRAYR